MTTIHTQDLDQTDFSEVSTGDALRPIHPGEILREEYLNPLGMSANALAMALKIPAPRINDIVREKRGITPDTALRLARYFVNTPEFWLNLQTAYDLRVTKQKAITEIEREVLPREVA
jgi:antitoxin HigA-1